MGECIVCGQPKYRHSGGNPNTCPIVATYREAPDDHTIVSKSEREAIEAAAYERAAVLVQSRADGWYRSSVSTVAKIRVAELEETARAIRALPKEPTA